MHGHIDQYYYSSIQLYNWLFQSDQNCVSLFAHFREKAGILWLATLMNAAELLVLCPMSSWRPRSLALVFAILLLRQSMCLDPGCPVCFLPATDSLHEGLPLKEA